MSNGYLTAVALMSSPSADQLATVLEAQLAEIDRTEPAVREISDPTAVHEMRVAFRRLRSILRAVRPLLDAEWVDRVREESSSGSAINLGLFAILTSCRAAFAPPPPSLTAAMPW